MFLFIHNGLLTAGRNHHVCIKNYKGKIGRINYRVRKEAFLNTKSNEDTASAKYILDLGDEIPKITETLLEWLRKNPLPQGILFENQQISIGALTALRKYGVNIPQEVKVVGFGMIPDYIYQDRSTPPSPPFSHTSERANSHPRSRQNFSINAFSASVSVTNEFSVTITGTPYF